MIDTSRDLNADGTIDDDDVPPLVCLLLNQPANYGDCVDCGSGLMGGGWMSSGQAGAGGAGTVPPEPPADVKLLTEIRDLLSRR